MNLYTFYNNFRGKLYISQVQAKVFTKAPILWAEKLSINKIKYLGKNTKKQLLQEVYNDVKEKMIIKVNQYFSVYGFSYLIKTGFGIVDFVKTDSNLSKISNSNFYTLIMDFREGTYFYQHTAKNELQVIEKWANELNINEIQTVGKKSKQLLKINISNLQKELYKVENTKNVWRFSYKFKTGHAVVYIIKTYWSL